MQKPWLINAFSVLFLLLPFGNYAGRAWVNHTPWSQPGVVLAGASPLTLAIIFFPFLVGIGLLAVRNWGWWLFVLYAPALIAYNIWVVFRRPVLYNAGALAQAVIAFAAIGYFLQRDVYAPYLASSPRGWRKKKRIPLQLDVSLDGKAFKTRDVSDLGCYVLWPACGKAVGDTVKLRVAELELTGTVARVDAEGLAIRLTIDEKAASAWRELVARRGASAG
jgi:hypothetical protein